VSERIVMVATMRQHKAQGDLDAELTLVRSAVEHPQKVSRILGMVIPDEFSDPLLAEIWRIVGTFKRARQPITLDQIVNRLNPQDVYRWSGCSEELSVADCVRQTIADGVGTSDEARWCALRIRADARRRELLGLLDRCNAALIARQTEVVRSLFQTGLKIAIVYRRADLAAARELRKLNQDVATEHLRGTPNPK
jgi:replicative DNA helicase